MTEHFKSKYGEKAEEILEKFVRNSRRKNDRGKMTESNPDRDYFVVFFKSGTTEDEWFTVAPKPRGYNRSNLEKFIKANKLPLTDTDEWVGKTVALNVNAQGFLRVAL